MSIQREIKERGEHEAHRRIVADDSWKRFATEWDGVEVCGRNFKLTRDGLSIMYEFLIGSLHIGYYHHSVVVLCSNACDAFGYAPRDGQGWRRHLIADKVILEELRDKMISWAARMEGDLKHMREDDDGGDL